MKKVAASILGLENKIGVVNELLANEVDWIHYDVMDGQFVENTSLPISEIKEIVDKTPKHIVDIHLMVNDVVRYIEESKGIANYITFHYEAQSEDKISKILEDYKDLKIGISINPGTPVEKIYKYLDKVTHVLVMSVWPGKGGQSFIEDSYDKVKSLKKEIKSRNLPVFIQVDGGVNDKTGPYLIMDGADVLVSGSFLTKNITKKTWQSILVFMC